MSSAEAASEKLGIPRRTLGYWMHRPEYAELRLKTRDGVADMFWTAIQIGVDQVAQGLLGDAPLRDKATALGILYDKHALLSGEVTSRSEHIDITADPDGVAAIEGLLAGRTTNVTPVVELPSLGPGSNGRH